MKAPHFYLSIQLTVAAASVCIFASFSFSAKASAPAAKNSVIDLVLGLNQVLVRQAPDCSTVALPDRLVVGNLCYGVMPGVRPLLARILTDPQFRISIFSSLPKWQTESILSQLTINTPAGEQSLDRMVFKSLSREDMKFDSRSSESQKDLSVINRDPSRVILIDSTNFDPKQRTAPGGLRLSIGPGQFSKAIGTVIVALRASAQWGMRLNQNNLDLASIQSTKSLDASIALYLAEKLVWRIDKNHNVVGCQETGPLGQKDYPVAICETDLGTRNQIVHKTDKSDVCARTTLTGFVIRPENPAKCSMDGKVITTGPDGKPHQYYVATIDGKTVMLDPSIVDLADNSVLPADVIGQEDSRLIGASIVRRFHRKDELKPDLKSPLNYYSGTVIVMAFNANNFNSIEQNCFLNEHQVNHSNGDYDRGLRAKYEDIYTHLVLESNYDPNNTADPVNVIRPKYAYLFPTSAKLQISSNAVGGYGNVFAVMKDEVKDRATFTPGDSLDSDSDGRITHSFYDRPDAPVEPIDSYVSYWEAQIWGKVCLSDVRYFLVNCPGLGYVPKNTLQEMQASGVPVKQCQLVNVGSSKVPMPK